MKNFIKSLFKKKRTTRFIYGYLGYSCLMCDRHVRLELFPEMRETTKLYYAEIFGLKVCSECYSKRKVN